ncbi:hypothetical protein G195_001755 [Phytophthora kernoviae 00238/432]|uniref:Copper amine oxidase-like N-terminal domain-containing protein n=1 Tax=Phytophthora kernoviae 00238/432 TaxID=1284355 RepID=A0A8J4WPZ6_9STRA|nr:hypothetical protein G195_001755 [Phytophthora kernoviae 00238/432]
MVPIRFVSEALGAKVTYSKEGKVSKVGVVSKDHKVDMTIGQTTALVNGQKKDYGTQIILKQNRTFVPLRLVSEGLGQKFGKTVELEPEEGKAVVKYWTTTGQSLDGVDGFANKEVKLEKDKSYNFTHTAPSEKYTYEGHKKSTQGDPSSLSRKSGDPGQFVYNGQYPNYYVYFYYKLKGDPPPPGGPTCTQPAPGRTIDGKYMDPVVTAMIKADQRGSEMFDVLKGIPTSESLSEPDERRPEYTVIRPYSYWTIAELGVYNIMEATLENYAFSGEQIVITPEGYTPPDFTADTTGDIYPAPDPGIVPGPSRTKPGGTSRPSMDEENLQAVAEAAVPDVQVENDSLIFKGQTIMNKQRTAKEGPQPGQIPAPVHIGKDVLYSPYNYIPTEKVNKKDTTSKGKINYILAEGSIDAEEEELEYDIHSINTVTVHTPVVNYSAVSDDQPHNQKTKPNMSRSALILERPFTVRIPTSGQHLDPKSIYPG